MLAWLQKLLSKDPAVSSKRVLALLAGVTLCWCTLQLATTITIQAMRHWAVDPQLVVAFLGSAGFAAGLAGVAYRKAEP